MRRARPQAGPLFIWRPPAPGLNVRRISRRNAIDDIPYLLRGITQMTTASSTLISSSRYLNNPRMREWVAQELLRKNGPDLPTPSGAFKLSGIIKGMQNYAEMDAML